MWREWYAAPSPKGRIVNKAQLIDAVAEKLEVSRRAAGEAVDAVLDGITGAVVSGDKVSLTGFGTFESAKRPARVARNPRTGEQVRVAAATVPKFRAGQAFKDSVNGAKGAAKKAAAKKAAAKKATAKTAAKKTTATAKATAKKTTAKKAVAKTTAKKTATTATAKRAAARPMARKTAAKAPATKTAVKKTAAKSTAAKKSTAKKAPARKR